MTRVVLQYLRGFFMGSADIVPGVSGGTVALVLGIYKELIANVHGGAHALKRLASGDPKGAIGDIGALNWLFLLPLGAGIVTAFLLLRHPMETLLIDHAEGTAAVFAGLVLASCLLVWREIRVRDPLRLGILVVVTVVTFVLLGFQTGAVADPAIWMFFVTGSIAICAMILPGISGSFIMLMMGMYAAVIKGAPLELVVFAVGAVLGLALFSSLLNWVLHYHEQTVLAALLGLMLGSFRVLWPWPGGVGVVSDQTEDVVKGTDMAMPTLSQAAGGVGLAVASLVITMVIVHFAEDDPSTELAPAPHKV